MILLLVSPIVSKDSARHRSFCQVIGDRNAENITLFACHGPRTTKRSSMLMTLTEMSSWLAPARLQIREIRKNMNSRHDSEYV